MTARNQPMSFRQLMSLQKIGHDHYQSSCPAWGPATAAPTISRAFGGHVYAQAAWAASQTVTDGLFIHNVTGHFLLPGDVSIPFVYHVKRVRDGGVYCLRTVEVYQQSDEAAAGTVPCFVSTVSFKRQEQKNKTLPYSHQNALPNHIQTEYETVLQDKNAEDHPIAPSGDAVWWSEDRAESLARHAEDFPGCEMRKVDMTAYNGIAIKGGGINGEGASKWRQLMFYRLLMDDSPHRDEHSLNLHACAHLYASDRNGLFLILRAHGFERMNASMGSLAHTVIFHSPPEDVRMIDDDGQPIWFVQEAWTTNSGDNRVCHNSRLWNYGVGKIFATTMQDGMMRIQISEREHKM